VETKSMGHAVNVTVSFESPVDVGSALHPIGWTTDIVLVLRY